MDCLLTSACPSPLACTLGQGICENVLPIPMAPCGLGRALSCHCGWDADGDEGKAAVALVTGGNRGVGYHAAKALLQQGHRVMLLCRDEKRASASCEELRRATGSTKATVERVDLADLASVEAFCRRFRESSEYRRVSILINNAGAISRNAMTINHVGHMALCLGLASQLEAGRATVVNVASCAHWMASLKPGTIEAVRTGGDAPGGAWEVYCNSKAANILFTNAMQRRLGKGSNVRVVAYHPGVMITDLWRSNGNTDAEQGSSKARSVLRAICSLVVKNPAISGAGAAALAAPRSFLCQRVLRRHCFEKMCFGTGGAYYQQACCCAVVPVRTRPDMYNRTLQNDLWEASVMRLKRDAPKIVEMEMERAGNPNAEHEGDILAGPSRDGDGRLTIEPLQASCVDNVCYAAFPCTEICSVGPNCACIACLC